MSKKLCKSIKADRNRYKGNTYIDDMLDGRSIYSSYHRTEREAARAAAARGNNAVACSGPGMTRYDIGVYKPSYKYIRKN